jgi:hypothetical protein
MRDDQTVPIAEICRFRKVTNLCSDPELLQKLLIESFQNASDPSSICMINEDQSGIKPVPKAKAERDTIILRDIPASTDVELLKACFAIPK